ncbi:hypothetical protein AK830_g134 [Neonectria ditissima]|uniref:Uncharacterized protein n=1 Tax=Neonectria ditissima TaxID=78410 RepID=A0A0P7BLZ0_9HYPO|nr:hypothetical protein AK830_g134 [Neonectria ditissima]
MELSSFFFGLFVGVFVFTFVTVLTQSRDIWRRSHTFLHAYLVMIWCELLVNLVFAIITFLYLSEAIEMSLAFLIATVTLWAIQTQLLSQIIVNRVALMMINRQRVRMLKLGLFLAIGCVNIVVYALWIPAHLPTASHSLISLNLTFERVEKSFFLALDLGLNVYFLYLVRDNLLKYGLDKYRPLFNFNAGIVCLATTMDALLLGMISLPNKYIYVQFSPLAYIVKLHIELTMAVIISKLTHRQSPAQERGFAIGGSERLDPTYLPSHVRISTTPGRRSMDRRESIGSEVDLVARPENHGIVKTVTTVVATETRSKGQGDGISV